MVKFKYSSYSKGYQALPNQGNPEPLPQHVFEIDAEAEEKDEVSVALGMDLVGSGGLKFLGQVKKKGNQQWLSGMGWTPVQKIVWSNPSYQPYPYIDLPLVIESE